MTKPINTEGSPFVPARCTCGAQVVAAPGHEDQARCLECARSQAGVTWPSGVPVGEWHSSGVGPLPDPPAGHTVDLWCFWCDETWTAAGGITPGWVTLALNQHERRKHPETLPKLSTGLRRDPGAVQ